MIRLYPDSQLLAQPMRTKASMVSYPSEVEQDILGFCETELLKHIRKNQYFPCVSISNPITSVESIKPAASNTMALVEPSI